MFLCLFFADFKSKFESERKDTDCYNSSSTPSSQQQQHPSPLLPLPTPLHPFSSSSSAGVSGVTVATPAHLPDSTTDSWSSYYNTQRQDGIAKPFINKGTSLKQRCRDYDGKNRDTHLLLPMFSSCFFHEFSVIFFLYLLFVSHKIGYNTAKKFVVYFVKSPIILPWGSLFTLFSLITNDHCYAVSPLSRGTKGFKLTHYPLSTLLSVTVFENSHRGHSL